MAEETKVATEATPQMSTPLPEEATNHFRTSFFGELQETQSQQKQEEVKTVTETKTEVKTDDEEILDPKDWLIS